MTDRTVSPPAAKRRKIDDRPDYCSHCTSMLSPIGLRSLNTEEGFKHYNKWECSKSAQSGCALCLIILQSVSKKWRGDQRLRFVGTLKEVSEAEKNDDSIPVRLDGLFGWNIDSGAYMGRIAVYTSHESQAAEFVSCRPIITDVAGDTAFSYARSWMSQCLSDHEHCKKQTSVALPSRLIDVGTKQDTPWIKLYTSETDGELGSYAALSYCWGGPQPVVASTHSLEKLKAGIAVVDLPQTIKDAVEVTRKLDLRYLWVDALCILQDCAKDKEVEIQRMGLIYQNATVTIAASAATSVREGFLQIAREHPKSYPFQLPIHDGATEEISLSTYHFLNPEDPLDTRGWAFQERLLSPRLLQFSGIELFWTCQTEPFKTISDGVIHYTGPRTRLPSRLFSNELRGGKSWTTPRQRIEMWTKIVSEYSKRKLTYPEDRLPALLGIVTVLTRIWKDKYVYGLWKECIVSLLGWQTSEKQHQRSSRAPSWSWASLDGSISFHVFTHEDAVLLPTGLASIQQQKHISLHCKIYDKEPLSKGIGIWKNLDLNHDEYPDEQIYYLLLGTKKTRKGTDHIGLMVINMAPGLFRRVGYFVTWREIWGGRKRQEIILE